MIEMTVSVDMSAFNLAVRRYVTDLHLGFRTVVRISARHLAEQLMKYTPPKSQAQGRAAVKRDIGRAMWLLDPKKIQNKRLAQLVSDQNFDAVAAFMSHVKTGILAGMRLKRFDPVLHSSVRDSRGRVRRSQRVAVLERRPLKAYIQTMLGHVGSTKYLWGMVMSHFGASVPMWILKHKTVHGEIEEDTKSVMVGDMLSALPYYPSVTMTNRGPGIAALSVSQIQAAINTRTGAMTRDVDRILAGGASHFF
jgi:hypothetical protein